jgi:hypothetical protein
MKKLITLIMTGLILISPAYAIDLSRHQPATDLSRITPTQPIIDEPIYRLNQPTTGAGQMRPAREILISSDNEFILQLDPRSNRINMALSESIPNAIAAQESLHPYDIRAEYDYNALYDIKNTVESWENIIDVCIFSRYHILALDGEGKVHISGQEYYNNEWTNRTLLRIASWPQNIKYIKCNTAPFAQIVAIGVNANGQTYYGKVDTNGQNPFTPPEFRAVMETTNN